MAVLTADSETTFEMLEARHGEAQRRLVELGERASLSTDEQVELARLQKEKLRLKDRMRNLQNQP